MDKLKFPARYYKATNTTYTPINFTEENFVLCLKNFIEQDNFEKTRDDLEGAYEDISTLIVGNDEKDDTKTWVFCLLVEALDASSKKETSSYAAWLLDDFNEMFMQDEFFFEPLKFYIQKNILKRSEVRMYLEDVYQQVTLY